MGLRPEHLHDHLADANMGDICYYEKMPDFMFGIFISCYANTSVVGRTRTPPIHGT